MIFQHTWQQVFDGTKTQTRRLRQDDIVVFDDDANRIVGVRRTSQGYPNGRTLWQVGKTYAVQPGRGQKAVGRIKLLAIRMERLQAISPQDALAEGIDMGERVARGGYLGSVGSKVAVERYAALWDSIHTAPSTTWAADPLVWVLEFELVKEQEAT